MAVAALCVILITPVASGKATVLLTPAAFICTAGMFMDILIKAFASSEELVDYSNGLNVPDWLQGCLGDGIVLETARI